MTASPRIVTTLLLASIWVALWQSASPANIIGGLLVAAALQRLTPGTVGAAADRGVVRPVAAARFLGHFVVELVKAALVVAWEVLTPRNVDRPALIGVDLRSDSPTIVTIVANAVTLTPGTVTVEASTTPSRLVLHVLHAQDPEGIRRQVRHMEDLAIAAFGPRHSTPRDSTRKATS